MGVLKHTKGGGMSDGIFGYFDTSSGPNGVFRYIGGRQWGI